MFFSYVLFLIAGRIVLAFQRPITQRIASKNERIRLALVPDANPYENDTTESLAGVRYSSVIGAINTLFPPQELSSRNSLSRTDGYWPFVKNGQAPPEDLTYGEFDIYFFAELLDRARQYHPGTTSSSNGWDGKIFLDIGSGAGRLVLAASALHPGWKECRGLEILPSLHDKAEVALRSCMDSNGATILPDDRYSLPMAPIDFRCASFEDSNEFKGDSLDMIFVFSSAMTQDLVESIGKSVVKECKPGTIIITTDRLFSLSQQPIETSDRLNSISLVEKVEGFNWSTGGASTAFIQRVDATTATATTTSPFNKYLDSLSQR